MPKLLSTTIIYIVVVLLLLIFPVAVGAQVVINEFSSSDSSDWIEFYNVSSAEIDLTGWVVRDTASSTVREFSGNKIPAGGFCFQTVSNRLNNEGDKIQLFNGSIEINCVAYGDGNGSFCSSSADIAAPSVGESASRVPDGASSWVIGTPSKTGASCESLIPTSTPTSTVTSTLTSTTTATPTSTPTPTKTPTPTVKVTAKPTVSADKVDEQEEVVLGLRNELATETPSPTLVASEQKKKFPIGALILIIMGLALVGGSGFVLFKKMRQDIGQSGENDNENN